MFAEDTLKKKELLFVTEQGTVRRTPWTEFETKKNTLLAYKVKEDDCLLNVELFEPNKTLMFVTNLGIGLNADISDVPSQSKSSSGVKGIKLDDGAKVIMASLASETDKFVCVTDHCFAKAVEVKEFGLLPRNRKGVKVLPLGDNGKKLLYAKILKDTFELFALDEKEKLYFTSTDDISTESRNSKGKSFAGKKGSKITQTLNT